MKRYSRRLLKHYGIVIGLGLIIGTRIPANGASELTSITGLIPILVLVLLIACEVFVRLRENERFSNFINRIDWKKVLAYSLLGVIAVILILWLSGASEYIIETDFFQDIFGIEGRFMAILNPLVQNFIIQSVGEHLPSPWGVYYYNLHILLFIMPIGFYYLFKRGWDEF